MQSLQVPEARDRHQQLFHRAEQVLAARELSPEGAAKLGIACYHLGMTRALLLLALPLVACMRPPQQLAGKFDPITVPEAQTSPREGVAVRWGGTLIGARPGNDQTCFEVTSFELDGRARPRPSDASPGRFLACAPGFFDPAVYQPGREITVVGALNGTTAGRVGDYDYTFPRVDAATVHLWPERQAEEVRPVWWPMIGISVGGSF